MHRLLRLIILSMAFYCPAYAQNKMLWNGEYGNPGSCNLAYGSIAIAADAYEGSYSFRAEPDKFHNPRIGFNCSGMWRTDVSQFDEFRFFIKSSLSDQMTTVRFSTYYAKGKWVKLENYLVGGNTIQKTYSEVRIPIDSLKTYDYDLSSVEYLEFSTSDVPQLHFYVDEIQVTDNSAPVMVAECISDQVVRIKFSEHFDTTDCYKPDHYLISSVSDTDFQSVAFPVKIGRHAFVKALKPVSGSPVIESELFLIFNKPFKNGHSYSFKTASISDLSGNKSELDTSFTFSDLEIMCNVKVNQVGYLPDSPKLGKLGNFLGDAWFMPIDTTNPPAFHLINKTGQTVFSGTCTLIKSDSLFSGESVFELDFSDFQQPGEFYLYVPGYGRSYSFIIGADAYDDCYYKTARALFFQRSGALNASHANEWARGGLPAVPAEIHSSHLASPLYNSTDYPPGTKIPMSGGWLDAGDYGRYVPTAASALFTLFTALELYPQRFPDNHLNIPESGNGVPDLIDEAKYETDWLLQMQAPDGGVYFRVTPATWSTGLPEDETNTLFVSEKTTQSTALFAAAMAMSYRHFKKYFPSYADTCLSRAKKAWTFLKSHPDASAPVNVPGISAGPYPDPEDRDNRAWAAAELYKSTGLVDYNTDFQYWYDKIPHQFHATMSWQQHTFKAAWAYATTTFAKNEVLVSEFMQKLDSEIVSAYNTRTLSTHAYRGAYHPFKGYIGYGTFGMAQSYAFDYILFSHILKKPDLLDMAKIQIDIPLGNNPLSMGFITGAGVKTPHNPLHWSSLPGKFAEPAPGIPVFGPAASLLMNRPSSYAIQDSTNRYPYGYKKEDPYPVLRRYTDARQAVEMSEFTVQEIAVTAVVFAYFSSVENTALPVTMTSFMAASENCRTVLRWTTATETNSRHFAVERSEDGKVFREIGRVSAAGQSTSLTHYQYTDESPAFINYYRITAVDFDGKSEPSRICVVKDHCNGLEVNITRPHREIVRIYTLQPATNGRHTLKGRIFSSAGRLCSDFLIKANGHTEIDISGYIPGLYILKVGDKLFTTKLFID